MRFLFSALVLVFLPVCLLAQSFPEPRSLTVNDFAGLVRDEDEAVLEAMLSGLRKDTGIELTVVTLQRQSDHAPDLGFESFATSLFNHWGVGQASTNSGIMVLVIRDDRTMRIELGSGYDAGWNAQAQRVIDRSFLPEFRKDNYSRGILAGVSDVIDTIARPFVAGTPVPEQADRDGVSEGWLIAGFLGVVSVTFLFDPILRLTRRCPGCNSRGTTSVGKEILRQPNIFRTGLQKVTTTCTVCDYHHVTERSMSRFSDTSSGGNFGRGGSSGGGASGRW